MSQRASVLPATTASRPASDGGDAAESAARRGTPAVARGTSLGRALVALSVVLTAVIGLEWAAPQVRIGFVAPELDLAIDTSEAVVALIVAALAWARFQDDADGASLYAAAAFAALAVAGGIGLIPGVGIPSDELRPGGAVLPDGGVVFWAGARALAALLLILTGLAMLGRLGRPDLRHFALLIIVPIAAILGLAVVAPRIAPAVPGLLGTASGEPGPTDVVVQVTIGLALLVAAAMAAMGHARRPSTSAASLAIGLVLAAFAQFHEAFDPTALSSLVCTGDALRLGFDGVMLAGILVQRRTDLRELREAYAEVDRLHRRELEHRALEERAHAAREVHDGVVQDLWLLKLRLEEAVAADRPLTTKARRDVVALIDRSIDDARQTIAALRGERESTASLDARVAHLAADFEAATGVRVMLQLDAGASPPSAATRNVSRVVAEALSNVARHADATVVRVTTAHAANEIVVTVTDNGVGFDLDAAREGLGLPSMRARAEELGARLRVESERHAGTTIELAVPQPRNEP